MRTPPNESLTSVIADAAGAEKSAPERKCILSGEHGARDALVRLAISPAHADGSCDVLPDPHAKAPGRGAWLGVSRAVLEEAMAKGRLRGALARAYKGAALNVPEDLPQRIADALARVLLDRLGLELRSGNLILGSDRIAEQARAGSVGLLLHAADASEGGASKLDQAWRVGTENEGTGMRGIRLPLDRAALSVALGRDNVVHLGVSNRGVGRGFERGSGAGYADGTTERGAAARVNTAVQRLMNYSGPHILSGTPEGAP